MKMKSRVFLIALVCMVLFSASASAIATRLTVSITSLKVPGMTAVCFGDPSVEVLLGNGGQQIAIYNQEDSLIAVAYFSQGSGGGLQQGCSATAIWLNKLDETYHADIRLYSGGSGLYANDEYCRYVGSANVFSVRRVGGTYCDCPGPVGSSSNTLRLYSNPVVFANIWSS